MGIQMQNSAVQYLSEEKKQMQNCVKGVRGCIIASTPNLHVPVKAPIEKMEKMKSIESVEDTDAKLRN